KPSPVRSDAHMAIGRFCRIPPFDRREALFFDCACDVRERQVGQVARWLVGHGAELPDRTAAVTRLKHALLRGQSAQTGTSTIIIGPPETFATLRFSIRVRLHGLPSLPRGVCSE